MGRVCPAVRIKLAALFGIVRIYIRSVHYGNSTSIWLFVTTLLSISTCILIFGSGLVPLSSNESDVSLVLRHRYIDLVQNLEIFRIHSLLWLYAEQVGVCVAKLEAQLELLVSGDGERSVQVWSYRHGCMFGYVTFWGCWSLHSDPSISAWLVSQNFDCSERSRTGSQCSVLSAYSRAVTSISYQRLYSGNIDLLTPTIMGSIRGLLINRNSPDGIRKYCKTL